MDFLNSIYDTDTVPPSDEVQEWARKQARSNARQSAGPLWAPVAIIMGSLVLVGMGTFLFVLGLIKAGVLP